MMKPKTLVDARLVPVVAVLLAVLHAVLGVTATIEKSPTFDEPTELTAGYSYWLRKDFRFDPENGNLPQRWAALPLLISRPNFPPTNASWNRVSVGETSQQFFYKSHNDSDAILFQGHIMMSVFSGALCLLIFFFSKELFGVIGGLISETIAVFDPNLLGHGPLVASDVSAALFFTAAIWSFWRLLHRVTILRFIVCALSVAGLFLSKMSAPLFLIMAGILAAVRIFSSEPIQVRIRVFQQMVFKKRDKTAIGLVLITVLGATTLFAIWASFCFRFATLTDGGESRDVVNARWRYLVADRTPVETAAVFAREYHLLPEAYLFGFAFIHKISQSRPAFLDNHWSNVGFRSYFPRAFSYKTPLPVILLLALGALAVAVRWKRCWNWKTIQRDLGRLAPIWALLLVYGAFVLTGNLNIGHRHLLPIYPALFIVCGGAVFLLRNVRLASVFIAVLVSWQITESFLVRPNYLAYFNQIAGGPANGYKHLVDSSLDWGQDLPGLSTWLAHHRERAEAGHIYLAYFGAADPKWYGIHSIALPEETGTLDPLQPGFYCISATSLQRVYCHEQGKWAQPYEDAYQSGRAWLKAQPDLMSEIKSASLPGDEPGLRRQQTKMFQRLRFARLCAYLRHRDPLANIGYSILVYRLTAGDLRAALDGPPAELAPTIEVATN